MENNKIKILHVGADNIGHGGRSTIAYNLAINMNDRKVINDFLAFNRVDKKYEDCINSKKGSIIFIEQHSKNRIFRKLNTAIRVIRKMRNNNYDIVHIHSDTSIEAIKMVTLAKIAGVKGSCIHAHTSGSVKKINWMKRIVITLCQKLISKPSYIKIACTNDAADYMYGKYSKNINIIKNGININEYIFNSKTRIQIRQKLGITNRFVIGCVARLTTVKNPFFLLDIFKIIQAMNSDGRLMLVGEGPLIEELKKYVKKINIEKNVIFLGNRDDVPDLMQAMDVFVLPSLFEGLGLVNIEAQAAGLPCIVSSGVPVDAKVLPSFTFLSLNKGHQVWADKILSFEKFKREDTESKIKKAEYDIITSSQKIQSLYLNLNKV